MANGSNEFDKIIQLKSLMGLVNEYKGLGKRLSSIK